MNWKNKLLILILSLLSLACQEREIIREISAPKPDNAGLPELGNGGGADTGGGNGLCEEGEKNCAPLESYRQEIYERDEYKTQVLPIVDKLAVKFRPLAADLYHLTRSRKWYFVPVELRKLPASRVGVGFMTDQLALHKRQEIWISTIYYNRMDPARQATLLLHELVMAVRLMEFQDLLEHCLAKAAELVFDPTKDYSEARKACFKNITRDPFPRELALSDYDHADIRDLTNLLLRLDNIQDYEIEGWIKNKGFRKY